MKSERIAVLIPCLNEDSTIASVIESFRQSLPEAEIYVYDNNSTDNTAEVARQKKALVKSEKKKGKGNVVTHMFREVDADYYVMVDGDNTYPAERVKDLLAPLFNGEADMVIGARLKNYERLAFRSTHKIGNIVMTGCINYIFGTKLSDVLSGYRAFTREFVKNVPLASKGFEVEVEMTMKALDYNFAIAEIPISYKARPKGSYSKLNTIKDGILVAQTILSIFKNYKPILFFSVVAILIFLYHSETAL